MEAALPYEQLPLFRRLPIPRGAQPYRRRSPVRRAIAAAFAWVQAELEFVLRTLDPPDPADDEFDFPEHRIVSAADVPPPVTRAPASIFAMAATYLKGKPARRYDFTPQTTRPAALPVQVERAAGVTRVVGAQYPAARWTEEKAEAERIRRAKQRPPKPTAKAKSRGKKVREWDGEGGE